MRCAQHDLAVGPDGTCVRCRAALEEARSSEGTTPALRAPAVAALVALGLVATGGLTFALRAHRAVRSTPTSTAPPASASASAQPLIPLDPALVPPDPSAASGTPDTVTPLARAKREVKIQLYCRAESIDCTRTRAWLLDHGYLYKEHNVDGERASDPAFTRIGPDRTVPAFDIDGQTFAGFDPARIEGALDYAAARRLQR